MTGIRIYWGLWLLVGFGVPEGWALATGNYKSTLSDTVWWLCDVTPGRTDWHWTFLHLLLAFLLAWLFGHLVWGLWR